MGYAGLRGADAFPVDAIRVSGTSGATQRAVLVAADARAGGHSLLSIDAGRLATALQAMPTVQRAHVDRDFPHTLRVSIVPERTVATLRLADRLVVVAASGRILPVQPGSGGLPVLAVPDGLVGAAGGYVVLAGVRREVAVAAALPPRFPVTIASVSSTTDGLLATTESGTQIRLGDERDLAVKLDVAARILRGLGRDARARVRYVEVSAPAFPALMAGTPNAATAGLVPQEGVQVPTLERAAQGTATAGGTGVRSGVTDDPGAVVTDLFGHVS